MNILIVNTFDNKGGAARSGFRLYNFLNKSNVNCSMAVKNKVTSDSEIYFFGDYSLINMDRVVLKGVVSSSEIFSSSILPNKKLLDFINNSRFDLVHVRWVQNSFLSIEDIARIKKPVVWSLHDMWAFTGGCHYTGGCERYKVECGKCPKLNSNNSTDLSFHNFKRKQKHFKDKRNIHIVGISKWIMECSKKSSLFSGFSHYNIPNPIDTELFKPLNKYESRLLLGLPTNKKLILFGAISSTEDIRKGFYELNLALDMLEDNDFELVVFGNKSNNVDVLENSKFNYHLLGHINDDDKLALLYSSADVMIVPSLEENLSNAIMESLSCGTPVVAFDIGGNGDLIQHKKSGYLAKPIDVEDLKDGISWILNSSDVDSIRTYAREYIVENFDKSVVVPKYIELYESVISSTSPNFTNNNAVETFPELLACSFEKYAKNFVSESFTSYFRFFYSKVHSIVGETVIYGNGTISKTIQALIPTKIIGYVDMADTENHPSKLPSMQFDKILISVLGREAEITAYLVNELGISADKIITFEL